jgi:hypothetical protein
LRTISGISVYIVPGMEFILGRCIIIIVVGEAADRRFHNSQPQTRPKCDFKGKRTTATSV